MSLTAAQKEAYARAKNSVIQLWTIELRHPTFVAPLRVVNYKSDFSTTLEASAPSNAGEIVLFSALSMRMREPEIDTEADATISVQVDGVPGAVQPYLANANESIFPIQATLRAYQYDVTAGAPIDGAVSILHLQVRHIALTKTTVSLTMGYTNTANRAFPSQNYTPETNPGLV